MEKSLFNIIPTICSNYIILKPKVDTIFDLNGCTVSNIVLDPFDNLSGNCTAILNIPNTLKTALEYFYSNNDIVINVTDKIDISTNWANINSTTNEMNINLFNKSVTGAIKINEIHCTPNKNFAVFLVSSSSITIHDS